MRSTDDVAFANYAVDAVGPPPGGDAQRRELGWLGVDLLPETVEVCQQVIEGRLRAREA